MSSFDTMIEQLMLTARDCVNDDVIQRVNAVVQLKLKMEGGEVQPFFVNLKYDGGSVERGEWSRDPVAATVEVQAEDVDRLLREEQYYLEAFLTGKIKLDVRDGDALGRLQPFVTDFRQLYRSTMAAWGDH